MKDTILNSFRITALERQFNLYGIEVYIKGKGVISHRWRFDDRENLFSGSKTFTSIGVGICLDEGRLNLTDYVLDFFPEYKENAFSGSEKIIIRDLLHMTSGKLVHRIIPKEDSLVKLDYADQFFREQVSKNPGELFFYSNACSYMLSRIIERVSGQTLKDYLVSRLFDVLDIKNPQWHSDENGHTNGASKLYLTTNEYLRLGIMLLNKGVYNDKKIVSESYLEKSVTDIIDSSSQEYDEPEINCGYGYHMWKCSREGAYRADGVFGQYCIVVPDKEAVVAITAHERKEPYEIIRAIYDDILEFI